MLSPSSNFRNANYEETCRYIVRIRLNIAIRIIYRLSDIKSNLLCNIGFHIYIYCIWLTKSFVYIVYTKIRHCFHFVRVVFVYMCVCVRLFMRVGVVHRIGLRIKVTLEKSDLMETFLIIYFFFSFFLNRLNTHTHTHTPDHL